MAKFFDDLKEFISEKAKVAGKKTEEVVDAVSKKTGEVVEVVSKKTGEVVEVVAQKTEQTVEIQKIKSQIRTMERNNERDYQDIGKMIYENFKKGEEVDAPFVELCEAIQEREAEIEKAKDEIADLKGLDVCPVCKAHMEASASFCPKCGAKKEEE